MYGIMKFLLVLGFLFLLEPAQAQINRCGQTNTACWTTATRPTTPGQGTFGYNTDTDIVEFYDGTSWTSATNGVINCRAFGAIGNAVNDDTAEIQACITYAHTFFSGGSASTLPVKIVLPPGLYRTSDTINLTGFSTSVPNVPNGPAVTFEAYGAWIFASGSMNNKAMIDMMGSQYLRILGLTVASLNCTVGSQANTGIQMGRLSTGQGAGINTFMNVSVQGCYTVAPWYNLAGEENLFLDVKGVNGTTTAGAYILILDGSNEFQLPTVAAGGQTIATGTHQSFLDNKFIKSEFTVTAPAGTQSVPVYLSGDLEALTFFGVYLNSHADHCFDVAAPSSASGQYTNWDLDVHCEASMLTMFNFIGAASGSLNTPTLKGFRLRDAAAFSTASIFKIVAPVTGVTFQGADIRISRYVTPGAFVFDNPANYSYSGFYSSTSSAEWNIPAIFSGTTCLGVVCDPYPTISTVANLPACAAATKGLRRFVTNQNTASAYRGAVTNGGAIQQFVYCDGTNWLQD